MPRKATRARYYPSRNAYYVHFRGKQHCLAQGPICDDCAEGEQAGVYPKCPACAEIRHQADLRFAELVHMAEVDHAEDGALVFAVLSRYLTACPHKPKTMKLVRHFCGLFADDYGHLKVRELKPYHMDEWLAKYSAPREVKGVTGTRTVSWGRSTRRTAIEMVNAGFNWAVKKRVISRNPIGQAVTKPRPTTRTKEHLIGPDEHAKMVEHYERKYRPRYYRDYGGYVLLWKRRAHLLAKGKKGDPLVLKEAETKALEMICQHGIYDSFAVLLRLLEHTGARPGEIYNATAKAWDPKLGAFVYEAGDDGEDGFTHKNAGKGKERLVFVSDPKLREIVEKLCELYPEGPLLRNKLGNPWTDSAVSDRFMKLKARYSLNSKITPYSYRHTSITNMLVAGQPAALVAETHGTSVYMLQRNYAHLDGHRQTLADWWAAAKSPAGAGGGETPGPAASAGGKV
jgi:integrase